MNTTDTETTGVLTVRISPEAFSALERLSADHQQTWSRVIEDALDAAVDAAERARLVLAGGEGASRSAGKAAERLAALQVAPRTGSQRFAALKVFADAHFIGATTDSVYQRVLLDRPKLQQNGFARRVTDLLQGGMVEPATQRTLTHDRVESDGTVTRLTSHGTRATVYVITGAGLRALAAARARA